MLALEDRRSFGSGLVVEGRVVSRFAFCMFACLTVCILVMLVVVSIWQVCIIIAVFRFLVFLSG